MSGVLKKRNEQVEKIDDVERGRLLRFIFLRTTKSYSYRGTQKVLGGFGGFT